VNTTASKKYTKRAPIISNSCLLRQNKIKEELIASPDGYLQEEIRRPIFGSSHSRGCSSLFMLREQ
jgi:hypothetical protein